MTDLYVQTLRWPAEKIDGKVYNAGWQNLTIREIAEMVKAEVGDDVRIVTSPTDDLRSYHVSSEKIQPRTGLGAAVHGAGRGPRTGRGVQGRARSRTR